MQYQMNEFLFSMILTELEDAVGKDNCSTRAIDKVTHSVDYYWLSRMWADRGCRMPEADFVVCPKDATEVSKVVKIANYYKIPVTTWGAGGGTQGGAIPVCGGADPREVHRLTNIPIYTCHGDSDSVVPVAGTREAVAAIRAAGGEHITYEELPGVDHNSWDYVASKEGLMNWLFSQRRTDK